MRSESGGGGADNVMQSLAINGEKRDRNILCMTNLKMLIQRIKVSSFI